MPVVRRMVCLANSIKKNPGRCVAGKEIIDAGFGEWVRPLGSGEAGAVLPGERQYSNGGEPALLDVLEIAVGQKQPFYHQIENRPILSPHRWNRVGAVSFSNLPALEDKPSSLWINGHSTFTGLNDYVPKEAAYKLKGSLFLIPADDLKVSIEPEGQLFNNPTRYVRAHFTYKRVEYGIKITDQDIKEEMFTRANGTHPVKGRAFLTVSLADHFEERCYKLVAGIITEKPFKQVI